MLTNRIRQALSATLQGVPLMATIEEFEAPLIEFEMEELTGGRFVAEEMAKGLKALTARITLNGTGLPIFTVLAVTQGADVLLTVHDAGVDQDNLEWFTYHLCGGRIKKIEEKTLKMKDKPVTVIELALRTYTRLENGTPMVDIDARTQKCVIGGHDVTKGARMLALMTA